MTINFIIGDIVLVNTTYVSNTLTNSPGAATAPLQGTLTTLGYLIGQPSTVTAVGRIDNNFSYIAVTTLNKQSLTNNNGQGTTLYFLDELD